MSIRPWHLAGGLLVSMAALTACTAAPATPPDTKTLAGWYDRQGALQTFQPCGQSEPWLIAQAGELSARVDAAGLQDGLPVYVRVVATVSPTGHYGPAGRYPQAIQVAQTLQVGAAAPVPHCALTGRVQQP